MGPVDVEKMGMLSDLALPMPDKMYAYKSSVVKLAPNIACSSLVWNCRRAFITVPLPSVLQLRTVNKSTVIKKT